MCVLCAQWNGKDSGMPAKPGPHTPTFPKTVFLVDFLALATFVACVCAWQEFAPGVSWLREQCLVLPCHAFLQAHLGQSPFASQCLLHSAGTLPVQLDQWKRATAGVLDQWQGKECAGSRPQCHHINIGEDIELLTLTSLIPPPTCQPGPWTSCMTVSVRL